MRWTTLGAVLAFTTGTATAGGTLPYKTVFLERCPQQGCLIRAGTPNSVNDTWSVNGNRVLGAFPHPDAVWNQVVECVEHTFAAFDVQLTETDPGAANHFEVKVGDSAGALGFGGSIGLAPFQCNGSFVPNNLVFVFAGTIGNDANAICAEVSQQLATTLHLDRVVDPDDVMHFGKATGSRAFKDAALACGSDCVGGMSPMGGTCTGASMQEHVCACTNAPTQSAFQTLLDAFGPKPADVLITAPHDNAQVQPGFAVAANVSGFPPFEIALSIDGEPAGTDSTAPYEVSAPSTLAPGAHEVEVTVTSGNGATASRTITVRVPEPEDIMSDASTPGDDDGGGADDGGCHTGRSASGPALVMAMLLVVPFRRWRIRILPR